jgi:Mrp family chromosome partitioning ATPase
MLVGLAPDQSQIASVSSEPDAAGLAELDDGTASIGDVIARDRLSAVHVISPGQSPVARRALLSSPRLATSFAALTRSYDYVVVDAGAAEGVDLDALAEIAPVAVLLVQARAGGATKAARERLVAAGFEDVTPINVRGAGTKAAAA